MEDRKITASIVLYKPDIRQTAEAIASYSPSKGRDLYLIDNSPEVTKEFAEMRDGHIKYHFVGKNIGYGSAHNIGMKTAIKDGSDYHVILNPDISFETKILGEMADFMEQNGDVVQIMPKIIGQSGDLQYLCKLLPTPLNLIFRRFLPKTRFSEKINDKYVMKETGYDKIMNVPCLSGCFMFLRTETIKRHNLFFDERFFMYCEDFDFVRRLHSVGKTIFYPHVRVTHTHTKESYKSRKMLLEHIKSAVKYFNKWGWFFDKERKRVNTETISALGG
jgi:GT2 family glycosyltransferase